jgi:hypothetical protein
MSFASAADQAAFLPGNFAFSPFHIEVSGTEYELEARTATLCAAAATVSLGVLIALLIRLRGAKGSPHPHVGLAPSFGVGVLLLLALLLSAGAPGCASSHDARVVLEGPLFLERAIGYAGAAIAVTFAFVVFFTALGDVRKLNESWPFGFVGFLIATGSSVMMFRHERAVAEVGELPHIVQGKPLEAHVGRTVDVAWNDPKPGAWMMDRTIEVTEAGAQNQVVTAYHRRLGLSVKDRMKVVGHEERGSALFPLQVGARWRFAQWTETEKSASHYFLFFGNSGSRYWSVDDTEFDISVTGTKDDGAVRTFTVLQRAGSQTTRVQVVAFDGETYVWENGKANGKFVEAAGPELAPGVTMCSMHGFGTFYWQTKPTCETRVVSTPPKDAPKTPKWAKAAPRGAPPRPYENLVSPAPGPIGWEWDRGSSGGWQNAFLAIITLGMVIEGDSRTKSFGRLVDYEPGDPTRGGCPTN